jgi:hypothetical protein
MGHELTAHTEVAKGSVFARWLPVVTMDDVGGGEAGIWRSVSRSELTPSVTL